MRLPLSINPYPDELLFSALCRAWERSPYSLLKFKRLLHTKTSQQPLYHTCHPIFPVRIDEYCSMLNEGFLSPESVVEHHSVIPYYRPFLSDQLYRRLLIRSGVSGHSITDHFHGHLIQYCPSCIREDLNAEPKRHPYLRSLHQIAGYVVCHRHQEWLETLPVVGTPRRHGYQFDALEGLSAKSAPRQPPITSAISTLAQDIASIPQVFEGVKSQQLWEAVANRLYSQGRRKELSKKAKTDIQRTVSSVPGLKLTRHGLTITCYQKQFFPIVSPLVQILIRYLGETPQSFVRLISSGRTRKVLHPCLNPFCDHHGQSVIEDSQTLLPGTGYFVFTCPYCGFAYALKKYQLRKLRRSGVGSIHKMRYAVYSLGKKLMPEFKSAWDDPDVSFNSLVKRFKLKTREVLRMARLQGLSSDCGGRLHDAGHSRFLRNSIERQETILAKSRTLLLDALEKEPGLLVFNDAMPNTIRNAMGQLYLNDPGWMAEFQKKKALKLKKRKQRPVV